MFNYMEIILSQRFNYSIIESYKDHSLLSDREKPTPFQVDESTIVIPATMEKLLAYYKDNNQDVFSIKKLPVLNYHLPPSNKKHIYYFSGEKLNRSENDSVNFVNENTFNHEIYTTDDDLIKKHYGRPFSSITTILIERSIVKRGDKVTLKLYKNIKSRKFNCKHFRKMFSVISLTINTNTGNFTIGNITKNGKITEKSFRVNNFSKLGTDFFNKILHPNIIKTKINESVFDEYIKILNNTELINSVLELFESQKKLVSNSKNYSTELFREFLRYFIQKKKIKIPNGDWIFWINNFYPTEKFLKKNDRKLLSSILDMFEIKSKITIKILHENPNIDLFGLYIICNLFGKNYTNYIGNIDKKILENSTRLDKEPTNTKTFIINFQYSKYKLSEIEKDNLLKIINSTGIGEKTFITTDLVNTINDHFNMLNKIREYDTSVYMRAKNSVEFHEEHRELSKLVSAIIKGWVVTYEYHQKTLDDIDKTIESHYFSYETEERSKMVLIYPHILKREEEYNEEGLFMHHCVASYTDKDKSIIVSLRTEDQLDRVTCEFDIQTGECLQSRHFCNGKPPEKFDQAIFVLKQRIKRNANWGTLIWKEKKKVPVIINGKEVSPQTNLPLPDEILF